MSKHLIDVDAVRLKPLELITQVRGVLANDPSLNAFNRCFDLNGCGVEGGRV